MALTNWIKLRRAQALEIQESRAQKETSHEPPPLNPLAPKRPRGDTSASSSGRSSGSARFNPQQHDSANTSGFHPETSTPGSDAVQDPKADVLAGWLHGQQLERVWTGDTPGEGVFAKKSKGHYACVPTQARNDGTYLYQAITRMNVRCAMTINTSVIKYIVDRVSLSYVQIQSGLRLQIVPDFHALPFCQRGQSAAFVQSRGCLVVWQDDPKLLMERADFINTSLMTMICGTEYGYSGIDEAEKVFGKNSGINIEQNNDVLDDGSKHEENSRELKMWQAFYTGIALILLILALGSGWREICIQQILYPNWLRLLFIICLPAQIWLSLFFFQALVGNIAQIFGPVGQMKENSTYYSGIAPKRLHCDTFGKALPHVTIQLPVYKEGLRTVIEPTVRSIKQAISTYELQGGTANVFVNDDGMQLIPENEAQERQEFYDEHSIGWVARPRHNPTGEHGPRLFTRGGKFKKASNMNYGLAMSVEVEQHLARQERTSEWNQLKENALYGQSLEAIMLKHEGEAWADGNLRIGDYILLIDSDTRVPSDCLLEAVSEMEESREVAILQYSSGVMNVTDNFFERGITFFTNMIYTMIRFAVSGGDVAPFVGHNAILRWSAVQEVAFKCPNDGHEKFWSENTVSEDFDMSLRLQAAGYTIRLGAYQGDGYKEGVSLTVYDELARWEKYAYGCNELIFNPLFHWFRHGPLTHLFMDFVRSGIPTSSKITIMAYIGTYYALASAWILTLLNYFLIGFFNGYLDHYYINSFRVYFAIVLVFTVLGNISLAVLRHRLHEKTLHLSLIENVRHIPLLTVFLGGISLHVSQAISSHFLSIPMEWGATSKESEHISFFIAISRVLRRFKYSFLFCFVMTAVMASMGLALEKDWRIHEIIAVWPMATIVVNHFLLPIVLNPQLMEFNF